MISIIRAGAFLLLLSSSAFAKEETDCGEYALKGILRIDETSPFNMIYNVNEGTKSKYRFILLEKEDAGKIALMIDIPTTINVKIVKPIDGYSGSIKSISEISRRLLDPLNTKIPSMEKIKSIKCD